MLVSRLVYLVPVFSLLVACDRPEPTSESSALQSEGPIIVSEQIEVEVVVEPAPDPAWNALLADAANNYAAMVSAGYIDALSGAVELRRALEQLVERSSEDTLTAAREAWLDARPPYLQTEVYRFYGGPVDHPETGVEGLLNAWPLDEPFVDYAGGDPDAGIIAAEAKYPEITPELLAELNEKEGEENISAGYHAIEFLLWGQDLDPAGPGARPFTDYVVSDSGPGRLAERRGQFLLATATLLETHLRQLVEAWEPNQAGNYRAEFLELAPAQAVSKIMTGFATLAGFELLGERLIVPYETQAQEDEHSCFSDNAHVDMIEDLRGLLNVWRGRYLKLDGTTVEGPGLQAVVAKKDADLADRIRLQLEGCFQAAEELPVPFDQALLGVDSAPGRTAIRDLIERLEDLADSILMAIEVTGLDARIETGEAE